ncbi:hypothetical protein MMC18_002918 [Xylographa bjoerkii]|nr:hypothetical protein [Xylographa bjoerkii]
MIEDLGEDSILALELAEQRTAVLADVMRTAVLADLMRDRGPSRPHEDRGPGSSPTNYDVVVERESNPRPSPALGHHQQPGPQV